jgi:nucleotide-binding universal stress UspA family protein
VYRKIVLAYDGSLEGRVALREGALLAKRLEAQVFLLAVTPFVAVIDAMGGAIQSDPSARAIFDEGLAKARELGLDVVGELAQGDATEVISSFAKRVGADLVVVGHRRKSLVERWWAGSGDSLLMDKLECSLLIGRNNISNELLQPPKP